MGPAFYRGALTSLKLFFLAAREVQFYSPLGFCVRFIEVCGPVIASHKEKISYIITATQVQRVLGEGSCHSLICLVVCVNWRRRKLLGNYGKV